MVRFASEATLGAFHSTPRGIATGESGITPGRALLNLRQARFAQRLYARPRDADGPEETLAWERSGLTTRLRAAATLRALETVEPQKWSTGRRLPGQIAVEESRAPPGHQGVEAPGHHLD